MKISNCIIESIKAWFKDNKRGRFGIRRSRCGRFFHVTYTAFDGTLTNFIPLEKSGRKSLLLPIFYGHILNHDNAWEYHIQLSSWGFNEKKLRRMSDEEVIQLYNSFIDFKNKANGDY